MRSGNHWLLEFRERIWRGGVLGQFGDRFERGI